MLRRFIERPVLSTVISVLIVLLGILGLVKLPIAQYPDISPPTVQVSATYPGANSDVVLKSVIVPLEQQINGVQGMTYITSSATNTGTASISVYFAVGTDPDQAAVDVQNRVSSAVSLLPQDVTKTGVTVRKQQSSNLLIMSIYSDDPSYDQTFLQNYAAINIIPQLQRVNGVGAASVFGSAMTYSMRIWLKPDVMSIYGVTASDVSTAINEQSQDAAPGNFGENDKQTFQYVITYTGRLQSTEEFGNIIVKSTAKGQYLRLKDIARIELGAQTYTGSTATDGKQSVGIAISQTPGSNARDVINKSKVVLDKAAKSFPPGIKSVYLVDINQFLDASIDKVLHTLVECFLLVFLVIFIFLQDFRSTIIHGISVPVAITGTFFFLYLFGFSINLLTLFALVLAIGIVVDDAIVVVEAVHAKLESGYKSPRKAAIDAMSEISGAIVSITLIMAAVFVPVTFVTGSAGVFYKQFGITLAVAIMISAINALTLCPALAAMFLKPPDHGKEEEKRTLMQRFGVGFNAAYDALTSKYSKAVHFLMAKKWMVLVAIGLFIGGFYALMKSTPSSFVPSEDMGTIFVNITLPASSTMERVKAVATKVDSIARRLPEVANTMRTMGQNFIGGSGSSYGMVILRLKAWDQRPGISNDDVIKKLKKATSGIKEASILFMSQPTITGFGTSGGFTFQLEDQGGHSTAEFYKVAQTFLEKLNDRPEIQYATTPFNPNFPQYQLKVDVPKCKDAGVSVTDVLNAMQVFYGSSYVSNFNEFGQQYRVTIQADTNYRANPAGLNQIGIRTASGLMSPITEFISLKRIYGPESVTRFNLFSSMSVSGSPNSGYSTGQALLAIQQTADQYLPLGYGFEYSGISREEQNAGSQTLYIFILCLVFVYLLLSAQYESYLLPLAVLLSLPVGLSGVFIFAKIFGLDNNIYMQISLIMLIGLLAKNAILMITFALERREKGMSILEAAIEGAKARLRPILMTSFAFVFGLMPLMFSTGVGANGNRSIGTGAIGGMLFGTLLGVFVVPSLFVIFQTLQEKARGSKKITEEEA
ncbi:efflux RND transporter permease subunit [Pedobacter nutrimenti]|uniref:HAE1 family hydrophobic/amphiphilic exporter-1 n=1 Tax=Pedobacter nutrimenti TaxID=1241337 RepID=A0A318UNU5_9SPHI|nr:efflux RND transporter permease subunit [Pedobacter nutrimenti]PYF77127.1 HAE1 family hydrophobic/amphiphilic exporter-1 [Pedobacter nutrimenti]